MIRPAVKMRSLICVGIAALFLAGCTPAQTTAPPDQPDPVVYFKGNDPEMNAAIAAARSTLDVFFKTVETDLIIREPALKVAVPNASGGSEHIWMGQFAVVEADKIVATVHNRPEDVPGLQLGDIYEFSPDQISDWSYMKDDKLHGGYTIRVILGRMSKDEAARFGLDFAPLP